MAHRFVFAFYFFGFLFFFFSWQLYYNKMCSPLNDKPIKKITLRWVVRHFKVLFRFEIQSTIFNWMKSNPGLLWFSCTCYVIGSENPRYFPNQNNTQNHHDLVTRVSRASNSLIFFISSSHWLLVTLSLTWLAVEFMLVLFYDTQSKALQLWCIYQFSFYFSSLDNLIASKPSRTEQGMIKWE